MLQYMQVQIFINDDKNDILDMKNKNKSKLAIAGTIITLGSGLVSCGGDANKVVQDINPSTPLENADSTPSVDTTKASVVVVEEMLDSLPPEPEPKVEPKNKKNKKKKSQQELRPKPHPVMYGPPRPKDPKNPEPKPWDEEFFGRKYPR